MVYVTVSLLVVNEKKRNIYIISCYVFTSSS